MNVRQNNVSYVLQHSLLICPPFGRVCNVPPFWKPKLGMASGCVPFKYQLNLEKISLNGAQKTAVICRLSFRPIISTLLFPCLSMVQTEAGTTFNPVRSQFNTNSGEISSVTTISATSFKNCFFTCLKSIKLYLLFHIVAFRLTYPILSKNDCAQALLIFTCPPYSTNMFLVLASNRPLVAAITICVVIAPLPSLIFEI